jgi:hypothetical protein
MIGMFLIGLGLGQLMQTLTMASQNSVQPKDMGVATSASTFFRQIGGTLGTAVLLSVLFSSLPGNILTATENKATLTSALSAALNPSVAQASNNTAIMKQLWTPIVDPIKSNLQKGLDSATTQVKTGADQAATAAVTKQVTAAVNAQVTAGAIPAASAQTVIDQQVASALPAAKTSAEAAGLKAAAAKANASVVDGKLTVDYSNATQRNAVVNEVVPTIVKQIKKGSSSSTSSANSSTSDTSFLKGADPRLSKPFLTGFNVSAVQIYWVGLIVLLVAFVITWFFRVPPLRQRSALQEQADKAAADEQLDVDAANAAAAVGTTAPADTDTDSVPAGRR